MRRRQRAGPRVATEQPARRQRVEGVVELGGLAVAHRRRLLLEEEPRAQRVALDLPDLADAEALRRLRDERAVREIELPDDEGGDLVAPIVEEAQRRERVGERLGGKAGEAHRLGGDARRREVIDDVADDRDGRALVDELQHARAGRFHAQRAGDGAASTQRLGPLRRQVLLGLEVGGPAQLEAGIGERAGQLDDRLGRDRVLRQIEVPRPVLGRERRQVLDAGLDARARGSWRCRPRRARSDRTCTCPSSSRASDRRAG